MALTNGGWTRQGEWNKGTWTGRRQTRVWVAKACECVARPSVREDCGGSLRVSVEAAANQGDKRDFAGVVLGKREGTATSDPSDLTRAASLSAPAPQPVERCRNSQGPFLSTMTKADNVCCPC